MIQKTGFNALTEHNIGTNLFKHASTSDSQFNTVTATTDVRLFNRKLNSNSMNQSKSNS